MVENRQNRYFTEKKNNFLLRAVTQLISPLKYSFLNVLTGNNHPRRGKNLQVENNDLKMTKNRLLEYDILTTGGKSHFLTMNVENIYNKK